MGKGFQLASSFCISLVCGLGLLGLIIYGQVLVNKPYGPLGVWYDVNMCRNESASYWNSSGTLFRVYVPRAVTPGALPGTPCPVIPESAPPIELETYGDVMFREGGSYWPLILVPEDSYALMTAEVTDAAGKVLSESLSLSIGNGKPPWTTDGGVPSNEVTAPPLPVSRPPSPPIECVNGLQMCTNDCHHRGDGDCDDGGTGADFTICDYGDDCTDCGPLHLTPLGLCPPHLTPLGLCPPHLTPPGLCPPHLTSLGATWQVPTAAPVWAALASTRAYMPSMATATTAAPAPSITSVR